MFTMHGTLTHTNTHIVLVNYYNYFIYCDNHQLLQVHLTTHLPILGVPLFDLSNPLPSTYSLTALSRLQDLLVDKESSPDTNVGHTHPAVFPFDMDPSKLITS